MIKRKLFVDLVDHLPQKEMSLIIGPRQAGKTTLMEMLREHLDNRGERTLFLNLDIEWDRPHFASQAALIKKIELELGRQRGYVFIDEIQRKDDSGLRNYSLGLFGHLESPFEKGFVFENLVFLLLRQKLRFKAAKLHFWRTKAKAEVDFVIEAGKRLIPVEVKYKHLKQDKVPASLRSFIAKYSPERAYIINLDMSKTIKIKKTALFFLPFYELLRQTTVL